MNGVHDMGGMQGFGPVRREQDEPVFHEPWEGRMYGMRRMLGPGNLGGRYGIEKLAPAVYLTSSYYERWLRAAIDALVEKGVLSRDEIERRAAYYAGRPNAEVPRQEDPTAVERAHDVVFNRASPLQPGAGAPKFRVGETVRARNVHPMGHTRLPRYARGKTGVVAIFHGLHEFQDTLPAGVEPEPQPLYTVRFDGKVLWGESAEPNQSVLIDMWESYLEPA